MLNTTSKFPHFPSNFYTEELLVIKGVEFTPRHIDIISCLVNGEKHKRIGRLLSIEERTVEAHKRKIRDKIAHVSNEDIIYFIQKSGKVSIVRKHYARLLCKHDFENNLKLLPKISERKTINLLIFLEKSEDFLKTQRNSTASIFFDHLLLAGLDLHFENEQKNIQGFFESPLKPCLYILTIDSINLLLQKISKDENMGENSLKSLYVSKMIFVLFDDKIPEEILEKVKGLQILDFRQYEFYFFSFLNLLEKIYPQRYLQKIRILLDEANRDKTFCEGGTHSQILKEDWISKIFNFWILVKKSRIVHFLTLLLVSLYVMKKNPQYFFKTPQGPPEKKLEQADKSPLNASGKQDPLTQRRLDMPFESTPKVIVKSDFKIPSVLLKRPTLMNKISEKLNSSKGINAVALIGVIGIGGAGKTVLARQFAKMYNSEVVWELNAERKESLMASFYDLAVALSIKDQDKKEIASIKSMQNSEEKEKRLLSFIQSHLRKRKNWLLIYDNVDKIYHLAKYFPQDPQIWGNGNVIITTRDGNISSSEHIKQDNVIQVEELTSLEKLTLFSRIFYNKSPRELLDEQRQYSKEFLENIPSFPLDVSAAAYYLKITGTSFKDYLKNLNSCDVDFERLQSTLLKEMGGYTQTRYNIITMSLERLIHANKNFKDLALFISIIDSQKIPRDLLNKYQTDTVVGEFIFNFKKYSLITNYTQSKSESYFSIHRSTQAIILAYLSQNLHLGHDKRRLESIACVIGDYVIHLLEKEDFNRMKSLLSHCEAFLRHTSLVTDEIDIQIKSALGVIYHYTSHKSQKAIDFFEASLEKIDRSGKKFITKARVMTLLADLFRKLGDYGKAEDLLKKSHTIYCRETKHSTSEAYFLASYGLFFQATSQYLKARKLLGESVSIYKKYPESYIGMARTLAYLGLTHADLGLYKEAINFMEKSRSIYKGLGEFHYRLGWVLMYIGDIYRKSGKFPEAKKSLKESLSLQKGNFYNEQSIDRIRVLSYLGIVKSEYGSLNNAVKILEKAVSIYETAYPRSFDRIWTMAHLAEVYKKFERYSEAQVLIEDALALHMKNIKDYNLDIRAAWLMSKLASSHNDTGNYREAWKFITKSLNIYNHHFKKDNIKLAKALFTYGKICKNLRKNEEASKLFERCLIQYAKNYGETHLKTLEIRIELARAYLLQGNLSKTKEEMKKIFKTPIDPKSNDSWRVLENLGDLCQEITDKSQEKNEIKQFNEFRKSGLDIFAQSLNILKKNKMLEEPYKRVRKKIEHIEKINKSKEDQDSKRF